MNTPPSAPIKSARDRRDETVVGIFRRIGWPFVEALTRLGDGALFVGLLVLRSGTALKRPRLVLQHVRFTGFNTLIIILIAGLFVGFVLGLQFYVILNRYGQLEFVGAGVALTIFRELGPVCAGLLFVGCACTATTAAIGLKKSSEQILAMEMMAVDPVARELSPRLWAGVIALPLLTIYFDAVGIAGAYLIAVPQIGIDSGVFWSVMQEWTLFYDDFAFGVLKGAVFGFVTVCIAVYEGYQCIPTAEGVARATTRTVIKGSLAVLGFNFILTAFMVE